MIICVLEFVLWCSNSDVIYMMWCLNCVVLGYVIFLIILVEEFRVSCQGIEGD